MEHIGGGMNLEETSHIFYKEIEGEKLAIINCCKQGFSLLSSTTVGSNKLNPICQYRAIQEARKNADKLV